MLITNAAERIASRARELDTDQLRAALLVAIKALDTAACEEIGTTDDYGGDAVVGLDSLAEHVGVTGVIPGEDEADGNF